MPLRQNAIKYIKDNIDVTNTDFYEFGINHGDSFYRLNAYIENYQLKPNKIWGFDSFVGLPREKEGLPIINGWEEGYFNVKQDMGVESTDEVIKKILSKNNTSLPCEMIAGFFNKSLTTTLIKEKGLKKASFIDIDVDLYQSTIDVFDFMIQNDLIHDTCLVNFDDWGGVEEYTGGESKAFKEIIAKYKINVQEIFSTPVMKDGNGILHVQKVFKIVK